MKFMGQDSGHGIWMVHRENLRALNEVSIFGTSSFSCSLNI